MPELYVDDVARRRTLRLMTARALVRRCPRCGARHLFRHWVVMAERCPGCGYRFGAPVEVCPYCRGRCQRVNAAQDILRLAMRHRVPVSLFRPPAKGDPLEQAGGVAALLRAAANWAPNAKVAQESEGHAQVI